MTTDTLRTLIRSRIDSLGITTGHAARLAEISDQTVRDYLGGRDLVTARALALAEAVGLAVMVAPVRGFTPPTPPPKGRRKNNPEKSGNGP